MYINIVLNILRVKFQMEGGKMAQEDPGPGMRREDNLYGEVKFRNIQWGKG